MSEEKTQPDLSAHTSADRESRILPCSLEEVESHLRAFIAAFILPHAQPRWLEFLIDKRSEWDTASGSPRSRKFRRKAEDVLRMFAANARYCTRIPNGKRTVAYYNTVFGKSPGVYFELGTPPCRLTALEAERKFDLEYESAVLSFQAGKKALFFCHDDGIWKCEKE